jgi:MFS family permease
MNRALLLLMLCQGFFLTNNVTFIAINGLVGLALAPSAWLATLPVTAYVAGGAMFAGVVARHQRAWGRRRAFQLGLGVAIGSTALCAWAALHHHFWGVVGGATLAGYYNANAGLYRFAATEIVAPAFKERAISWVLAGGIIGAVAGPNLARATRNLLPTEFAGAYAALALVALCSLATISWIRFPPLPLPSAAAPGRPLREIVLQPVFIVAVVGCAFGYGVMNLLMAATPIAMAMCSHPFANTALVLEWHVLGMFVPSFFTGNLIRRFGAVRVMAAGVVLNVICIAVALSGVELERFLVALFTLGVGWNFLFIGGTSLVTTAYRPEEKTRAQAAMDTTIFTTMTITSFSSGALVTTQGWTWLNLGSIVPVALTAAALAWFAARRRAEVRIQRAA